VDFVGHNLTKKGNYPASSKDTLLVNWLTPTMVRDIASFIGFGNLYSKYIPYFEQRISPLRSIMKEFDYNHRLKGDEWTKEADAAFHDIRNSILSKPCLQRISADKRPYLLTDFSAIGLGNTLAQPSDNPESTAAMKREDAGGQCEFNRILTGLHLQPCGVAACPTRGYEKWLHSHPGEGIFLSYGIGKWRHVLFARPFTDIGDCSGLQWIMFYEGTNPIIHCIQMELMSW
jgi:hypothetical protein